MGDPVLLETLLHPVEQILVNNSRNAARRHNVLVAIFADVAAVAEDLEEAVLYERLPGAGTQAALIQGCCNLLSRFAVGIPVSYTHLCQGAAEKSANATRTGASRQIPSRFPTPRNVYRDDCRFVVDGTGREPERAKAGYHYGSGILPFAILNRVWYTRLSSTNLHLED